MPYINVDTPLIRHRKFKKFKRFLNINDATAIGHLVSLWSNVLELAEDGEITKWSPEDIAEYACFGGEPEIFFQALNLNGDGFMDIKENRKFIHDWWDYAGRYLTTKYRTTNPDYLERIKSLYYKEGGKSFIYERMTPEARKWRDTIILRDGECVLCQKTTNLIAHHIKSYENYPNLRWEFENGITLCVTCHKKTYANEDKYEQELTKIYKERSDQSLTKVISRSDKIDNIDKIDKIENISIQQIRKEYIRLKGWDIKNFFPDDFSRTAKAIKTLVFKAGGQDSLVLEGLAWISKQGYGWSLETLIKQWAKFMKENKRYEPALSQKPEFINEEEQAKVAKLIHETTEKIGKGL